MGKRVGHARRWVGLLEGEWGMSKVCEASRKVGGTCERWVGQAGMWVAHAGRWVGHVEDGWGK